MCILWFYCSSKITSVVSETELTMASLGYDLWDPCLIYYLCSIPCKTNLIPCFPIPDFVFPYRFIFTPVYVCVCVSVCHACGVILHKEPRSVCQIHWSWVTGSCEPPCVDAKKDPLEEQYMLLSTEPSLQPLPFLLNPFDSSYSLVSNPSPRDRLL